MLSPNNNENNEIDRNDAGFNLDNENGKESKDGSEFECFESDDEVEKIDDRDPLVRFFNPISECMCVCMCVCIYTHTYGCLHINILLLLNR